jgi:hypothetical protein
VVPEEMPEFETWVSGLFNLATFLAMVHVVLGTCFFSSILFLSASDAIKVIMRLLGSAIACRIIIWAELAGMKASGLSKYRPERLHCGMN